MHKARIINRAMLGKTRKAERWNSMARRSNLNKDSSDSKKQLGREERSYSCYRYELTVWQGEVVIFAIGEWVAVEAPTGS
jgi:hypothetical protein